MAEREPWEDELVEGLVEAGNKNFSAADSEEAMGNIAEPIAKAIKQGGSSGQQQQSDWNETDTSKVTFIKNKPSFPSDIPSRQEMAAAIGVETTRAMAAEASLQTQINGKASQSALEAETARAEAAESALDTRLTTAESDIDTLESGLSAETEARESADSTLQANIDNEAIARENADNALDARLDEAESDIDALQQGLADEIEDRGEADRDLQSQIDAISSKSDVVDVVASYVELLAYDTSELGDNDVIKVLRDEMQDDAESYYRWHIVTSTWSLIGTQGPFVTPAEMQTELNGKVDKVTGKGLSTNDYTTAEKTKLAGIASGAEVNVNADWDAIRGDAQILNKPSAFPPSSHTHSVGDVTGILPISKGGTGADDPAGADYNITAAVRTALGAIDGNFRIVCAQTSPSTALGNLSGHRTFNQVWDWIKSRISSVLGLTATNYGGKAATAGTADKATADASGNNIASTYATKSEIPDVNGKENTSNKVTTLDNSTTHYPSTSAVTTALNGKANANGSNASGDWAISATKGRVVSRTDFDALVTTGTYEILIEEEEELSNSNHPPTEGTTAKSCRGFIEVRNVGGTKNAIIQQATYNVGYISTRRRLNNAWTSWERMTYIPNGSAVGSLTQPVYVDVTGAVQPCSGNDTLFIELTGGNRTLTANELERYDSVYSSSSDTTTRFINIDATLMVDKKKYFVLLGHNVNLRLKASNLYDAYYHSAKLTLSTSYQEIPSYGFGYRFFTMFKNGYNVYLLGY